jgi:hypothetical protein|nr:MAG TPA: Protein of unknown function (DUF2829) [Crassvirales sp.]
MTKEEAIKAMSEGKKVRHNHFSSDEWMSQLPNGDYLFEDGVKCSPREFWTWRTCTSWNTDWEIVE